MTLREFIVILIYIYFIEKVSPGYIMSSPDFNLFWKG
jgi:hypothetical protein